MGKFITLSGIRFWFNRDYLFNNHIFVSAWYISIIVAVHPYLFSFFSFLATPRLMSSRPGIRWEPQLWPAPQVWQHYIIYLLARSGIKPSSQCSRNTADPFVPQQELLIHIFRKSLSPTTYLCPWQCLCYWTASAVRRTHFFAADSYFQYN